MLDLREGGQIIAPSAPAAGTARRPPSSIFRCRLRSRPEASPMSTRSSAQRSGEAPRSSRSTIDWPGCRRCSATRATTAWSPRPQCGCGARWTACRQKLKPCRRSTSSSSRPRSPTRGRVAALLAAESGLRAGRDPSACSGATCTTDRSLSGARSTSKARSSRRNTTSALGAGAAAPAVGAGVAAEARAVSREPARRRPARLLRVARRDRGRSRPGNLLIHGRPT